MADEKQPEVEEESEALRVEKEKLADLEVSGEVSEDVKGGAAYTRVNDCDPW